MIAAALWLFYNKKNKMKSDQADEVVEMNSFKATKNCDDERVYYEISNTYSLALKPDQFREPDYE